MQEDFDPTLDLMVVLIRIILGQVTAMTDDCFSKV